MSSLHNGPMAGPDRQLSPFSRRTFLKQTALSATAATAMLSITACGGTFSSGNSNSGEIVIWDRSGDLFQVFDATIASFNKKYPDIKVKHVAVDIATKLPKTLTTGVNVPDGTFYEDNNLPVLAEHYHDITEWIEPHVKDIVPFKVRVNTHEGRIYGIPWDLDPGLLYYRTDMLEEAGVDATTITTYDELFKAAQKVQTKFGDKTQPIHLEQDPGLTQLWVEMFANQQGKCLVSEDGKLQLDAPEYLTILKWLHKVRTEKLGNLNKYYTPGDIAAIEANQVAFYPWAIWAVYGPELLFKQTKGKWRAMALPAWTPGGTRAAVMGGSSFVIPKKSKNPRLAWLFYEHLVFSPEGYKAVYGPNKIYKGGLNTSIPSYLPALEEQLFESPAGLDGQNLWEVAVSTVKDIPGNYVYPKWYNQAVPYFAANIQRMFDGQMTPEQVIQKSSQDIQTKLIDRA